MRSALSGASEVARTYDAGYVTRNVGGYTYYGRYITCTEYWTLTLSRKLRVLHVRSTRSVSIVPADPGWVRKVERWWFWKEQPWPGLAVCLSCLGG